MGMLPQGQNPLPPFVIPSVVSGAQKTVKDLEQMSAADAESIIDSIEELMVEANHNAGSGSGLADPVLSKSNRSLTQGELHADQQFCQ